jgi:hypothetical protein
MCLGSQRGKRACDCFRSLPSISDLVPGLTGPGRPIFGEVPGPHASSNYSRISIDSTQSGIARGG